MLLLFYNNVVNFDEDGGVTTILDEFGKKSPKTDGKAQPLIDGLKELSSSDLPIDVSKIKDTDDTFKSFLKTWDGTGDVASKYNKFLESSSNATSSFGSSIKSLGANLLSIGANMIIWTLISTVIQGICTAVSNWVHRVEIANEAMNEAVSEYDSTKSRLEGINTELEEQNKRISELQAKGNLTYAEKGELEKLQEITKELLIQKDIEERNAERASKEVAIKTVDAFEKQYGKQDISKDSLEQNLKSVEAEGALPVSYGEDDVTGNIAVFAKSDEYLKEYQEKYAKAKNKQEAEWIESQMQTYIDTKDAYSDRLDSNISDLSEKKSALSMEYEKAVIQKDSGVEPLTSAQKETIQAYEEIESSIRLIYEYTNPSNWNTIQFADVFNKDGMEKTKDELIEMSKSGKLTPESIESFTNLNGAIEDSDLILKDGETSAQAFCDEIEALANATEDAAENSGEITIPSTSDITANLGELEGQLSNLDNAMASLKNGEKVDVSTLNALSNSLKELKNVDLDTVNTSLEQLGTATSLEEAQPAMDALLNEYLRCSGILEILTEDNAEFVASQLESMGVANAQRVVTDQLAIAKEKANTEATTFTENTVEEMSALMQEKGYLESTHQAMYRLYFSKLNINNLKINTADDIRNLIALANAAGASYSSLVGLQRLLALMNDKEAVSQFDNAHNDADSQRKEQGASQGYRDQTEYTNTKDYVNAETQKILQNMSDTWQNINPNDYIQGGGASGSNPPPAEGSPTSPGASPGASGSPNTPTNAAADTAPTIQEAFYEVFDWMERKINYLERLAKKAADRIKDSLQYALDSKYVDKTFQKLEKQMSLNAYRTKRYQKSADDVGLDAEWVKRIKTGDTIDYSEITDEGLSKKIKEYEDWYKKSLDCKDANDALRDSVKDLAETMANAPIEKAAEKLKIYETSTTLLDAKSKNAISAQDKNKLIDKKTKNIDSTLVADKQASETSNSNVKKYTKKVTEQKVAKGASTKQKDKYKDLMKKVKSFTKSGKKIDDKTLEAIYDYCSSVKSFTWYENCVAYNASIDAKASAKETYDLYQETSQTEKSELTKEKFDNVSNEYSNKIGLLEQNMQNIENQTSIIEAKGQIVHAGYYENQKKANSDVLEQYKAEKASLENMLPTIQEGTDDWYDAKNKIQECASAISECEKNTLEYNNAINKLNIELFERAAKQIDRITSEQEFLAKLMSHEKQFDENGSLTESGLGTLGTYANSYYANLEKANRDKVELDKLQGMLGRNDLGTFNSVDQLKERIDELYSTWQDDILATYGSQEDIFNMMSDKFDAELDAVKELIDAKKEALSVEKELYDYQNQIAEKTKSITTLQKRIAAYKGDTSQEGQAKLQKLQVSLQDAQKDLKDTEYEKYISDQEDMLDKLYTDYSETIQKRLEDFQEVVQIGLNTANDNSQGILAILDKVSGDNGYNMQYTTGANTTLQGFVTQITGEIAKINTSSAPPPASDAPPPATTPPAPGDSPKPPETEFRLSSPDTIKNNVSTGSIAIDKNSVKASSYIYSHVSKANKSKSEYSDINQAIYSKFKGKILSSEELRELAKMLGVVYNGASKTSNLYKKLQDLRISGFSTGGIIRGLKSTISENGDTFLASVNPNETILTEEFTRMLPDAVGVMSQFNDLSFPDYSASAFRNLSSTVGDVQFNFELSGCQNTEDMLKEIQQNPKVQRAIQSVTVDQMLGKPRLSVMSIK